MKIFRKAAAVIMCFVLITAIAPTPEFFAADGELIDGVYYKIDGDHAIVTGCKYSATEISILPEYNGYPVTQIVDSAFNNRSSLKKVTIADSITSIGNSAFRNCDGLADIELPDSITSIGNSAFYGCRSLTRIVIPSSITYIRDSAFAYCEGLQSITIPNSVTNIGGSAFFYCGLISITIPDSVISIGESAFSGCSKLASITLPKSVTSIGASAFSDCTELSRISIPDTITSIEKSTFFYCTGLTSITIPDSVISIGESAFSGCSKLASIIIPESVTYIGKSAFSYCKNLTNVKLPNNLTVINDSVFSGCRNLKKVNLPKALTYLGYSSFSGTAIESIEIPKSLSKCGTFEDSTHGPFSNCSRLKNITFEEGITTIPNYMFSYCDGIETITIPDSVTNIGWYAFQNCTNLKDIKISDSVTNISYSVFSGCTSLTNIKIPDNVTSIDWNAFRGCTGLKNIIIPEKVTDIGGEAFFGCTGLSSITIPDSTTRIGWGSFSGCTGLTSITISRSVTDIGDNAFSGCENLTIRTVKGSYADTYAQNNNIPVYYYLNDFTPEAPTALTVTENSVVLIPTEGYEYRMDDGEWRDSNVFENLTRNSSHKFYQRMKATANCPESFSSPAADISTLDHDYREEIIPPTRDTQGYTLHTCNNCGDTYKDNYTSYEPGENDPFIKISSIRGMIRDQVKVFVSLKNNPGIVSMALELNYDKDVLKLVNVEDCGVLGEQVHNPELTSPYYLNWVNDTATENFTANGNIVILTFEILENAPLGKTPITVSYTPDNYEIYDKDENEIEFFVENGYVDVSNVLIGDVNGDGVVNGKDRLLLTRWLAKWPEALAEGISEAAADVNYDGKINGQDRLILTRHLARWTEYATLPYIK